MWTPPRQPSKDRVMHATFTTRGSGLEALHIASTNEWRDSNAYSWRINEQSHHSMSRTLQNTSTTTQVSVNLISSNCIDYTMNNVYLWMVWIERIWWPVNWPPTVSRMVSWERTSSVTLKSARRTWSRHVGSVQSGKINRFIVKSVDW